MVHNLNYRALVELPSTKGLKLCHNKLFKPVDIVVLLPCAILNYSVMLF